MTGIYFTKVTHDVAITGIRFTATTIVVATGVDKY
jgi:hypothetical protein